MVVYAPKNSEQRRVNPTWPPGSVRERKVGPLAYGLRLPEESPEPDQEGGEPGVERFLRV